MEHLSTLWKCTLFILHNMWLYVYIKNKKYDLRDSLYASSSTIKKQNKIKQDSFNHFDLIYKIKVLLQYT